LDYLFAGPGEGLIGRALPERALDGKSLVRDLAGSLCCTRTGLSESTALSIAGGVCFLRAAGLVAGISLPAHQQFSRGSFIFCAAENGGLSPMDHNFMTIGFFI